MIAPRDKLNARRSRITARNPWGAPSKEKCSMCGGTGHRFNDKGEKIACRCLRQTSRQSSPAPYYEFLRREEQR